jgi:uncharacterized membrane protein YfcA
MAVLSRIPTEPLRAGIGLVVVIYVVFAQDAVTIPGLSWLTDRCFNISRGWTLALGGASGFLFGATNVGVQVVAYLESQNLDRKTFVGVLSGVFLGISALRILAAAYIGLLPDFGAVGLSLIAAVPGVVGGAFGSRIRPHVRERYRQALVLGLQGIVGLRLALQGLGV